MNNYTITDQAQAESLAFRASDWYTNDRLITDHATMVFDPAVSAFSVPSGTSIITMSDLHIGAYDRIDVSGKKEDTVFDDEVNQLMINTLPKTDMLILNGDIFEMIYPESHASRENLVEDYMQMLDRWIEAAQHTNNGKGTQIHIVTGNHDDNHDIVAAIQERSTQHTDILHLHPVGLRVNETLFIHGDIIPRTGYFGDAHDGTRYLDAEMRGGQGYTENFPDFLREIVDSLIMLLHYLQPLFYMVADKIFPPERQAQKLNEALEGSPLLDPMIARNGKPIQQVTDVVVGHTHTEYDDVTFDNSLHFHNTGTILDTRHFNPFQITMTDDGAEFHHIDLISEIMDARYQRETSTRHVDRLNNEIPAEIQR